MLNSARFERKNDMWEQMLNNKEWILSGIGTSALFAIVGLALRRRRNAATTLKQEINGSNNIQVSGTGNKVNREK